MNRAALSRADLLRCLAAEGHDVLTAMAGLAGYRRRSVPQAHPLPERPLASISTPVPASAEPKGLPEGPGTEAVHGVKFYRVVDYRPITRELPRGQRPDWYYAARPLTPAELRQERLAAPEPEPLVPWPRLWPFLRAVFGFWGERREPDLGRLVDLIARGRTPRRLPRRRLHRWAPACQLILDLSPRLTPFHEDYWRLLPALRRLRGHVGLDVFVLRDGPDGEFRRIGDAVPISYQPPEPDIPLLILGDLGCLGEPSERAAWRRFGRRLRRAGCTPVALMPCPPRFWYTRLAGLFFPVTWDRSHRLPRSAGGPRPWPGTRSAPADDLGAARLLTLLAPAVRLEPALLRNLRHTLLGAALDVGAEAAAWVHPYVRPSPFALNWADQAAVERHRSLYGQQPKADRHHAGELIRRHHAHLPPSIRAEEAANLAELDHDQVDREAADYLARTLRTLEQADAGLRAGLTAWAARLGARQHASAWSADPRRTAIWVLAHREQLLSGTCELPLGLDVSSASWVLGGGRQTTPWTLFQQGTDLVLAPKSAQGTASVGGQGTGKLAPNGTQRPGSPVASLELSGVPIQYTPLAMETAVECSAPSQPGVRIPLAEAGLRLRGDHAELMIEPMPRPNWAECIGRDAAGLYVEVTGGQGMRRLRWLSPANTFSIRGAGAITTLRMPVGAFWDEDQCKDSIRTEFAKPDWAEKIGIDGYGLWADFIHKGVTQRMRWIWPGEFTMGSPQNEPDRLDDELQHPVLLTHGLWLADTACTQALWQAETGDNPSRFKGAQRPVEGVSWEQIQAFIARLNDALPGLNARLPTEAEWEYACRAGSETPFAFGETITTDQVNYNGHYPYRGDEKGGYREQSVEVKALPANAWGLYQMHGNVWEWCQDWYASYPDGTAVDPWGGATGASRVLRGGSWLSDGGSARSARRDRFSPDIRDYFTGFRLARGPIGRLAEPESRAGQTQRSGVGQALREAWGKVRGQ